MSQRVNLPPGCSGFDCKDGTKYKADKPGGSVVISDRHADAVNKSQFKEQDFISAQSLQSFGTKVGRYCQKCRRLWNAWNDTCPRCGEATVEE
jgi:hypothetical protein